METNETTTTQEQTTTEQTKNFEAYSSDEIEALRSAVNSIEEQCAEHTIDKDAYYLENIRETKTKVDIFIKKFFKYVNENKNNLDSIIKTKSFLFLGKALNYMYGLTEYENKLTGKK